MTPIFEESYATANKVTVDPRIAYVGGDLFNPEKQVCFTFTLAIRAGDEHSGSTINVRYDEIGHLIARLGEIRDEVSEALANAEFVEVQRQHCDELRKRNLEHALAASRNDAIEARELIARMLKGEHKPMSARKKLSIIESAITDEEAALANVREYEALLQA